MKRRIAAVERQAGGEHARDDVRADVGAERGEGDRRRAGVNVDAEVGRGARAAARARRS